MTIYKYFDRVCLETNEFHEKYILKQTLKHFNLKFSQYFLLKNPQTARNAEY